MGHYETAGFAETNITTFVVEGSNTTSLLQSGSLKNVIDVGEGSSQAAHSVILFYSVMSPVFFVGIVGNFVLILIFACHAAMRTGAKTYIFNLAIVDLVTVVGCASSPLLDYVQPIHPVLCKLLQVTLECSIAATPLNLIALSADRYYAIAHPLNKVSSKSFSVKAIVMIWLLAIVFVLGKLIVFAPKDNAKCVIMFNMNRFSNFSSVVDFLVLYFAPLTIIATFYILMAKTLYFQSSSLPKVTASNASTTVSRNLPASNASTTVSRNLQARKKIAGMVIILVAMYALCYFPFHTLSVKLYLESLHIDIQTLKWANSWTNIILCIGCLHNTLNPIILYTFCKVFRGHFNRYLFCCVFPSANTAEDEFNGSAEVSKKLTTGQLSAHTSSTDYY